MIPKKYKKAHYAVNRFKPVADVKKWFEREETIYTTNDMIDINQFFMLQCQHDFTLLSLCLDFAERTEKLINTANILRLCNQNIQTICLGDPEAEILAERFPL